VERTLQILKPVCSALGAAHSIGLLHRDIKPSNIILHRGPYDISEVVKVVDFGIAKFYESPDLIVQTSEGIVLGTAEYMSPEQCQGQPLDGRCDVYSIAMVCYQMLSGRLAFLANSTGEFLFKHVSELPKPMRDFYSDIPPQLESVVLAALAKDPEKRPPTAPDFYNQLEQAFLDAQAHRFKASMAASQETTQSRSDAGKSQTSFSQSSTQVFQEPRFNCFTGRSSELNRLKEAWHGVCSGQGKTMLILGEPGIGKTYLLEELCGRVAETGAYVFYGKFYESSGIRSFHAAILDLKGFIRRIESKADVLWEIFGDRAKLLLDKLDLVWKTGGIAPNSQDPKALHDHFATLADTLAALARHKPLLLALDDLQYSDESARDLFSYLTHRLGHERVFLVSTVRPVGLEENFKGWLKSFRRACETITLPRFQRQQILKLLEAIFGRFSINERLFSLLKAETGGNPYFLVELLKLLLVEKRIQIESQRWVFNDINTTPPQTLIDHVELIVERMSPQAKKVFNTASVIGEEFDSELLCYLMQSPKEEEDELVDILQRGTEAGLITKLSENENYRFNNTTIRRVLYESLNRRARKKFHKNVAEWLVKQKTDYPSDLVYHYYESAQFLAAFRQALKAADRAREAFQIDTMRRYVKYAEKSISELEELSSIEHQVFAGKSLSSQEDKESLLDLITFYWLSGLSQLYRSRADKAEDHLQRGAFLARATGNILLLGKLYNALGMSRAGDGIKIEAIDFYKQALECYVQENYIQGEAQTLRELSLIYEQRGDYALALDFARASVDAAEVCTDESLQSFALSTEAWMLARIRRFEEAMLVVKRAIAIGRKGDNLAASCSCFNTMSEIYVEQGLYEEAIKVRREALKIARLLGNRRFELAITRNLGELYIYTAKYQDGENLFLKALKLVETGGNKFYEHLTLHNLVHCCINQGKLIQARAYLSRAEKLNSEIDLTEPRCQHRITLAELLVAEKQFKEAIVASDEALSLARTIGHPSHEWRPMFIKATALKELDMLDQARETISECVAILEENYKALDAEIARGYFSNMQIKAAYKLKQALS
ncbi:MAG: AAA family ATPase, partial [Blastocatellia bacterium]|nr:AAA family ATPase [Blastocatellia bacterium]